MYKVQLAAACLVAATQAIDLNHQDSQPHTGMNLLAQAGIKQNAADSCCCQMSPCVPTCSNMCDAEHDHHDEEVAEEFEEAVEAIEEQAEPVIDEIVD